MEIIPAILTDSEEELVRLAHMLERAGVKRAHLDIIDGTLVPGRTVEGYDELRRLASTLEWDIHLMVAAPGDHIAKYEGIAPVKRFIVHVEASGDLERAASACTASGREFWAAINPDTALGALTGLSCHLDGALFMTVVPGAQGRPFRADALDKLKLLKAQDPHLPLMVDGGINPETAPQCVVAGATHLVSGSYVVRNTDPASALAALRDAVNRV